MKAPRPEIRAVLYDFGGVFTASPFAAVERAGAEQGLAPGQMSEIVFGPFDEDTDHAWHRLERGEIAIGEARDAIIELGRAKGAKSDPFALLARMGKDGGIRNEVVERALAIQQAGFRTAVVTNNIAEIRDRWKAMLPHAEIFEVIVDSSEIGVRKPSAAIYETALRELGGIPPEQAIFFDDHPQNVRGAEALGIQGVLVENDFSPTLALLDALAQRGPARS
jgi:epoxide hydrolase-like predicted phosphatase